MSADTSEIVGLAYPILGVQKAAHFLTGLAAAVSFCKRGRFRQKVDDRSSHRPLSLIDGGAVAALVPSIEIVPILVEDPGDALEGGVHVQHPAAEFRLLLELGPA